MIVWYVARGEQKAGPYPLTQLRAMAVSGNLSPDDRICPHNKQEWTRAAEVPHVFEGPAAEWVQEVSYFGPAKADEREYADFGQRFAAWFVDGVITYVGCGMIANALINAINGSIGAQVTNWNAEIATSLIKLFVAVSLGWVYEALQESSVYQATLGKRLVAIRVTDLDGGRISLATATKRYFGKYLSLLTVYGYICAGITERRQALHDSLAGTLVVKD